LNEITDLKSAPKGRVQKIQHCNGRVKRKKLQEKKPNSPTLRDYQPIYPIKYDENMFSYITVDLLLFEHIQGIVKIRKQELKSDVLWRQLQITPTSYSILAVTQNLNVNTPFQM
jgi:hypothetical protein